MGHQQTCGQGLAEHGELSGKLAGLIESVANVLHTHREALNPRDANSRREDEAYRELALTHRKVASELRDLARRLEGYRDLPMGRHDEKVLSSPKAVQAFEKFVTLEGQLAALLQKRLETDRYLLDEMRRAQ